MIKLDIDKIRMIGVAAGVVLSTLVTILIPGSAILAELIAALLIAVASGIRIQRKEPIGVPCHVISL